MSHKQEWVKIQPLLLLTDTTKGENFFEEKKTIKM